MDFPRMVTFAQVSAPASDVRFSSSDSFSNLLQSLPFPEPRFDELETLRDSSGKPYISVQDFCEDGFFQASPASSVDTPTAVDTPTITTGMPIMPAGAAVQTNCTLQPHVYSPSVARIDVYQPPPSGKVVELQLDPPHDQRGTLQNDTFSDNVVPLCASGISAHPIMQPDVFACDKPPPASSFSIDLYQPCADPKHMQYSNGTPAHYSSSFSFPHVEGNQEGKLSCQDVLPDGAQLTSPNYITPQSTAVLFSVRMPDQLPMLDVVRSPRAGANGGMNNILSPGPAFSQDSLATDVSSASAPAALPTSNPWLHRTFVLPESGSFTEPPSPSPSVNQSGSTRRRSPYSRTSCKVAIKVKTKILNLHDGYTWKKYGEKVIKGSIFKRSYYRCDEVDRCQCKVLKRIQMCDDGENTLFTYSGRHSHPL